MSSNWSLVIPASFVLWILIEIFFRICTIPIFLHIFAAEIELLTLRERVPITRSLRPVKALFSISLPGTAVDWELREAVTAASCCPAYELSGARINWDSCGLLRVSNLLANVERTNKTRVDRRSKVSTWYTLRTYAPLTADQAKSPAACIVLGQPDGQWWVRAITKVF